MPTNTKACTKCKVLKSIEDFARNKYNNMGGRKTVCKVCIRQQSKEYRNVHKEKLNERSIKYYYINKDSIKKQRQEYNKLNSTKFKNYRLLKTYGISLEEKERMINNQNGLCACCNERLTLNYGTVCVDHDHSTGIIRKILCRACNLALGIMNEDPKKITRLLQYSLYCEDLRKGI